MIEIVVGTNRANSNSRRIGDLLMALYGTLQVESRVLDLRDLPTELLDPGAYALKPAAFEPLQERVLAARGLHVVVPEYNGSFPGALKLFIDMLKFPESFEGKPVAYVGVASGQWGGLRPVEQLQMIFGYRNAHSYPQRVFIAGVHRKFSEDGVFGDPEVLGRLEAQAAGFTRFINQLTGHSAG
jgi:NAD(P)H-dependent FMN reductase